MREPGRADPVLRSSECCFGAAGGAVAEFAALGLAVGLGARVMADPALEVELALLPGVVAIRRHRRVERPGRPLLAVDPDTFSGRVLRQCDRQSLAWRVLVLGPKTG